MLSRELEETLRRAMSAASSHNHEFATLEHLLSGTDRGQRRASRCCRHARLISMNFGARLSATIIENELASIVSPTSGQADVQPTASFQRVIQRAIIHTQSSGREVASGANVLVAIFSERESHAVWFLKSMNMTRLDAVTYHQSRC